MHFEELTYFIFFRAVCCNHQTCISCARVLPQHLDTPTLPPTARTHLFKYTQQTNGLCHPDLSNYDDFVVLLALVLDRILTYLYLLMCCGQATVG